MSRRDRAPLIFAVVGVLVAIVAGAVYAYQALTAPPRLAPEDTVREFLTAAFLSEDPDRLAPVVCASWTAAGALARMRGDLPDGARVSWDELRLVSASEGRATVSARLGTRQRDDVRPSGYQQWRFNLVDQDGWRVCDAGPFVL